MISTTLNEGIPTALDVIYSRPRAALHHAVDVASGLWAEEPANAAATIWCTTGLILAHAAAPGADRVAEFREAAALVWGNAQGELNRGADASVEDRTLFGPVIEDVVYFGPVLKITVGAVEAWVQHSAGHTTHAQLDDEWHDAFHLTTDALGPDATVSTLVAATGAACRVLLYAAAHVAHTLPTTLLEAFREGLAQIEQGETS